MQLCHYFKNAIQKNQLGASLLFVGNNRIEKELLALRLSSGLFCEKKRIPFGCGQCLACTQVADRKYPYLRFLELDTENGSEIKVDQIRELIETPGNPSWIIPRAELLNKQASNALLKTLEEPRGEQFFILIAPSTRSLLPTLVSRCQRIYVSARAVAAQPTNTLCIPKSTLARLELIETLIKSKADLKSLFSDWSHGASLDLKERLFQALQDLERHVNSQLILERLLL